MTTTKLPPARGTHRYEPLVLPPVGDFDERGASEYLGIPVRTLQTMRYRDKGPAYYKIGDGPKARVRYRRDDLAAWRQSRIRRVEPDAPNASAVPAVRVITGQVKKAATESPRTE